MPSYPVSPAPQVQPDAPEQPAQPDAPVQPAPPAPPDRQALPSALARAVSPAQPEEPDAIYADPRLAACYDTFDGERDDLDHYQGILAELGARSVIDVGCGTGSLATRLAADGLVVIGVDPARASLDVARAKPHGDAVTWIHGTVADLPAPVPAADAGPGDGAGTGTSTGCDGTVEDADAGTATGTDEDAGTGTATGTGTDAAAGADAGADAAVMTGNVAQVFLTDEAWAGTLRGIRGALREGGALVFESRRPQRKAWEDWQADTEETVHEVPGVGRVRVRPTAFEVALPLVSFADEFTFEDGSTVSSTSTLRWRDESELRATLAATGFEVQEIREAPDRPGREFVVIARAV